MITPAVRSAPTALFRDRPAARAHTLVRAAYLIHEAAHRTLQVLEWAYVPATEILMHLQVIWRPFGRRSQGPHLPRAVGMLLQLHVLNFFDAFHHSFEQFCVDPDQPVPMHGRDRAYEQRHTYSNLISRRHAWLNLLTLNFGYHNAHHQRPSVAWYRLPATHRELYGDDALSVIPLSELLRTWHRNRVRRVIADDYGVPGGGRHRADDFVGAHGASFLTVI